MKIVYFGTDVFLSCFEYFVRHHHIMALYTYHNGEDYFTEYAIVRRARELGIPVHYESVTEEEILRYMEDGCGLFFLAEYNRLLPVPPGSSFRGINVHSSLLPQGRSYYPIECAMERGLIATGVTLHKVTERLDGGEILAQRRIPVPPEEDSVDVYLRCGAAAREMLEEVLGDFEGAWRRAWGQTDRLPYWRRPAPGLLTLDHGQTAAQALDMFRRYNSLCQVNLRGRWHHVTALEPGTAPFPRRRAASPRPAGCMGSRTGTCACMYIQFRRKSHETTTVEFEPSAQAPAGAGDDGGGTRDRADPGDFKGIP